MPSEGPAGGEWVQLPHTTSEARRWAVFWVGVIAALGALDAHRAAGCDGSTLSEVTRMAFRTDTRHGKLAFLGAWTALYVWFTRHILK